MEQVVVTRYPAVRDCLADLGLTGRDAAVLSPASVSPEQLRGKHVWVTGHLAPHLAVLAAQVSVLPLRIPARLRGRELTAAEIRDLMGAPCHYRYEPAEEEAGLPVLVVAPEEAYARYLQERGMVSRDARVTRHIPAPEEVSDLHVYGELPPALAAKARAVTSLVVDLPRAYRDLPYHEAVWALAREDPEGFASRVLGAVTYRVHAMELQRGPELVADAGWEASHEAEMALELVIPVHRTPR